MKIATWNVNSIRVRMPHLLEWLQAAQPDVVGLQELKCLNEQLPAAGLEAAGYRFVCNGQKTYNGVAILARNELTETACDMPGFADEQKRVIAATVNGIRIVNAYVVNGQAVGSEKYAYKLRWLEALRGYIREELGRYPRLLLMGDFNIAPSPEDTHDAATWEGNILCSEPERAAFRGLLDCGLTDSYGLFPKPEQHYTWWDYRQAAFRRNMGLRIDHLLLSAPLIPACRSWQVDLAPRRLEKPSDHAPVIIDLAS